MCDSWGLFACLSFFFGCQAEDFSLLHLIRADTVSAYQCIRLFVLTNSVKLPILIRTRKFRIHVTFQPSICKFALFDATAARRRPNGMKKARKRETNAARANEGARPGFRPSEASPNWSILSRSCLFATPHASWRRVARGEKA